MNLLTDDDFRDLVNQIPPGATFTFISDSCHSGGPIDAEKEQIGDREGGGGGLFGMVANVFQGSSEGRDFDYGGQRRRNEREEEELGEDEEPGYGRRRRGGYGEQEEGYEGRQESEYEGYGERREGYGGRRESEYEGYGRRREPEAEGYGGRRESEFEGYGGRRGPEYEGYGGRRGNIQGGGARPAICRVRAAGPPPLVTFTSQPRLTAMSPVRDCDEACRLLLETHHRSFILQTVTTFMKQRSCNVHEATFLQRS